MEAAKIISRPVVTANQKSLSLMELREVRDHLPRQKGEIVRLEVEPDPRNGKRMFAPQIQENDSWVGGKTSMRFFVAPASVMKKLRLGDKIYARVTEVRDTGKKNRRGAHILTVWVKPE